MVKYPIHIPNPKIIAMWKTLDSGFVWWEALNELRDCPLPLYLKEDSKN